MLLRCEQAFKTNRTTTCADADVSNRGAKSRESGAESPHSKALRAKF
jgi:hypothetical protein